MSWGVRNTDTRRTTCHVTDKADKIWLESAGLSDLWEDIALERSLVVRPPFKDDE